MIGYHLLCKELVSYAFKHFLIESYLLRLVLLKLGRYLLELLGYQSIKILEGVRRLVLRLDLSDDQICELVQVTQDGKLMLCFFLNLLGGGDLLVLSFQISRGLSTHLDDEVLIWVVVT